MNLLFEINYLGHIYLFRNLSLGLLKKGIAPEIHFPDEVFTAIRGNCKKLKVELGMGVSMNLPLVLKFSKMENIYLDDRVVVEIDYIRV